MNKILINRIIRISVITAVYAAIISIFTFPLYTDISGFLPGFHSSDEPYAAVWYSWRIQHAVQNHLPLMRTDYIAYPFGVNLFLSGILAVLWLAWTHFLAIFAHPAVSYNIQALSNTLLCALFAYGLIYYLTGLRSAGFFGGLVFAFSPYQSVRTWQHLSLSYNQWIPLALFAAILLKDNFTKKRAMFFLFSLLLLFSFDYSILYLGTIALFAFFIYVFFYMIWKVKLRAGSAVLKQDILYLKGATLIVLTAFLLLGFQFYPIIDNMFSSNQGLPSAFNAYKRPFEDLFIQSARPFSYFFPAAVHPVFGEFTEQFIGSFLYGVSLTEHTLYLGLIPMILAFVGFRGLKKRGGVPEEGYPPSRDKFYIRFFVFLAVVAWLFSQPPWWNFFGLRIYMPSFFMYKILPMFRAYCRFGIVLMLAVAVLAGFGLKFILMKVGSRRARIALVCLFCGLVLFEFWNWPPYKVIDISMVPGAYYWVKDEPGNIVIAEYPMDADSPNEMYKFYQTTHEKKIINGTIPGTYANKVAQTIRSLSDRDTPGILKWMGIKYALVHREDYLKTGLVAEIEELGRIPDNPGIKFIRSFPAEECPDKDIMCVQKCGPIDVYEITADPVKPAVQER